METGETLKANAANVKEIYLNTYHEYRKMIALKCAAYKIDLVEADIAEGYSNILTAYLIKRQKMG